MAVSRAEGKGDPEEYQASVKVARFARARTGDRIKEMIVDGDLTGSRDLLTKRLRTLVTAEAAGDPLLIHEALMEISVASAAYAVDLQLRTPVFAASLREDA